MAKLLAERIRASKYFEVLCPTRLNVVCFTLSKDTGSASSGDVRDFLGQLTSDGKVCMTATTYKGSAGIRAALCNWRASERDVQIAYEALERCAASRRPYAGSRA